VLVGGSMEPTIDKGSLVFDELVRVRELRAGDVITYTPPGARQPVTHRIISAKRQKTGSPVFRTQGDANAAPDMRPFKLDQPTQARYRFSVPYLGWAFIALGTKHARFILLALPALLIALAMLGNLWREGGQLVAQRGTT
jgi:signal peptidase I